MFEGLNMQGRRPRLRPQKLGSSSETDLGVNAFYTNTPENWTQPVGLSTSVEESKQSLNQENY